MNCPIESIVKELDKILSSKSILELDWKRLTPIVGPSRDKISEKDHNEKNRVPVLDKVGNIIWLKNEFEVEYKFFCFLSAF